MSQNHKVKACLLHSSEAPTPDYYTGLWSATWPSSPDVSVINNFSVIITSGWSQTDAQSSHIEQINYSGHKIVAWNLVWKGQLVWCHKLGEAIHQPNMFLYWLVDTIFFFFFCSCLLISWMYDYILWFFTDMHLKFSSSPNRQRRSSERNWYNVEKRREVIIILERIWILACTKFRFVQYCSQCYHVSFFYLFIYLYFC